MTAREYGQQSTNKWVTERVTKAVSESNIRQRAGDRDKQKAHDSTGHILLPLSSKFTPQYLFWDNGQNSFKQLPCTVNPMFIFLSRGRLRDAAGGRGCPPDTSCSSTVGHGVDRDCRPRIHGPSMTLTPPPGLAITFLQPSHMDTSSPRSLPVPCTPTSPGHTHQDLLMAHSPPAFQKVASYRAGERRLTLAWASQSTVL